MCSSPCRHEWASACQFMVLSAHYHYQNRELLLLDLEKINKKASMASIDSIMTMRQDEQQELNNKMQVISKQVCLRRF